MILTCPACDTKYVVKDDAIPPGGRQVRCASCKHSWHQEPEGAVVEAESVAVNFAGPPEPASDFVEEPLTEAPPQAVADDFIAGEPEPDMPEAEPGGWYMAEPQPPMEPAPASEVAMEEAPAVADEWRRPVSSAQEAVEQQPPAAELAPEAEAAPAAEEEFVGYAPIAEEDEAPRRRWPLILGVLVLIVAAAAAFWFLAPAEWKAKAGIAQAGATPLKLMISPGSGRVELASGNELITVSGRVINDTAQEQSVPPIHAELRDKQTGAVVHRWTIAPPARVLPAGSSASFNSAEVNVPKGGDELTVTLGG